jgi:hypothetical protein
VRIAAEAQRLAFKTTVVIFDSRRAVRIRP